MLDPEINAQALDMQLKQPEPPLLLDVREKWEFDTAHIDNSLLMPMGDVPSRAHAELDPDEPVVVICHHGARSLNVTMWLRAQGFEHVQSLAGGIDNWSRAIDPSIPVTDRPSRKPQRKPHMTHLSHGQPASQGSK